MVIQPSNNRWLHREPFIDGLIAPTDSLGIFHQTQSHLGNVMRLVWDATVLQKQQNEESTRDGTCTDLSSMFARPRGERTESFLPSQKITSTVAKEKVEDPGYTLTIEYISALPSSLLIDTRLPPSGFTLNNIPAITSSSFARYTSLPMIAAIVPPVAMILPQLN